MCDFVPGDEVVYVGPPSNSDGPNEDSGLPFGSVHAVEAVVIHPFWGWIGLRIAARPGKIVMAHSFRKVQRRDLSAWLETATDFEEPKRAPVDKERVR